MALRTLWRRLLNMRGYAMEQKSIYVNEPIFVSKAEERACEAMHYYMEQNGTTPAFMKRVADSYHTTVRGMRDHYECFETDSCFSNVTQSTHP